MGGPRAPDKRAIEDLRRYYFYFSTKTYAVISHKNRLDETVLIMGHKNVLMKKYG